MLMNQQVVGTSIRMDGGLLFPWEDIAIMDTTEVTGIFVVTIGPDVGVPDGPDLHDMEGVPDGPDLQDRLDGPDGPDLQVQLDHLEPQPHLLRQVLRDLLVLPDILEVLL